jgi:hypothetical protein
MFQLPLAEEKCFCVSQFFNEDSTKKQEHFTIRPGLIIFFRKLSMATYRLTESDSPKFKVKLLQLGSKQCQVKVRNISQFIDSKKTKLI